VELEASGGITVERIAAIARTGVQRISLGALTHSARSADLSLEIHAGPVFTVERAGIIPSTMQLARERADAGAPEGTTIVAESQTGGRGRRGRVWFSAPGAGLYLSCIVRPGTRDDLHALALVAGVALVETAHRLGATAVRLKWPNDLVIGEKKLAGVLLESDIKGAVTQVLIGIGLNLAPRASVGVPADIEGLYLGLADAVGGPVDEDAVLAALLENLERRYAEWKLRGSLPAIEAWRRYDALAGSRVRAESAGGAIEGVAEGIDERGRLRIRRDHDVVLVNAGEVIRVR
jgi:BirA family biotin operon repressor/biotin-[acetyl-CoA-carboxylase] ligase